MLLGHMACNQLRCHLRRPHFPCVPVLGTQGLITMAEKKRIRNPPLPEASGFSQAPVENTEATEDLLCTRKLEQIGQKELFLSMQDSTVYTSKQM